MAPDWQPFIQSNLNPWCQYDVSSTPTTVSLAHNVPAPPGLSVYIDGTNADTAFHTVTMTAVAANGAEPYSYSWTVNGVGACGNQVSCSAQLGDQGTYTDFAVTVTDAALAVASSTHSVFAQWVDCPDCWRPSTRVRPTGVTDVWTAGVNRAAQRELSKRAGQRPKDHR